MISIGAGDDHCANIFDWKKSERIASIKTGGDPLIALEASSVVENEFCAAGIHGAKFGSYKDGNWTIKNGVCGGNIVDFTSVKYMADGRCLCGSITGEIFVFSGNVSIKSFKAHSKAITALGNFGNSILISAGNDMKLNFYG